MYCTIFSSARTKKWSVVFYDDFGKRNTREAQVFDSELEATNACAELMATEGLVFIDPSPSNKLQSAILDKLVEYENMTTYTDCEEYWRQGGITALEELVERMILINGD